MEHGQGTHKRASRLSLVGGGLSLACAIHCLLMPILLPVASTLFHSFWIEASMLALAVVVGAQALRHGYRVHGFRLPAIGFVLGFALVSFGNWGFGADHLSHPMALPLLMIGGVFIVAAHVSNFVLERRWIRTGHHHD
ncbi:MAG: MerC domain-containing protein [Fimbriimonadales bacterium]